MCGKPTDNPSAVRDLAAIMERELGLVPCSLDVGRLQRLLESHWSKVSTLAHAVHDGRNEKLKKAARNVAALDHEGVMNVVQGRAVPGLKDDFLLLADEIRR